MNFTHVTISHVIRTLLYFVIIKYIYSVYCIIYYNTVPNKPASFSYDFHRESKSILF